MDHIEYPVQGLKYQCLGKGCDYETNSPAAMGKHHQENKDHRTEKQQSKYLDNLLTREAKRRVKKHNYDVGNSKQEKADSTVRGGKAVLLGTETWEDRRARLDKKNAAQQKFRISRAKIGSEVVRSSRFAGEDDEPRVKRKYTRKDTGRTRRNASNKSTNHKHCTHCGGPRTGSFKFCAHCGMKLL